MEMNLKILTQFNAGNVLIIAIVLGLILSKFLSGLLAGRIIKLNWRESSFFGASSMIQITTTLAVTYVASSFGLIDQALVNAVIIMSVITTIIGPILLKNLVKKPSKA